MQITDNAKLVYGLKEASAATNLSRAFLFKKIASGELKAFKIGNRRLIHGDDLMGFINSYRSVGMSAA